MVRLPGQDTELLGIDRAAEAAATRAAASIGVGPRLVAFVPELGVPRDRVHRRAPRDRRTSCARRLPEVAALLRRIHAGPELPVPCSPLARAESYRAEAARRGGAIPADYDEVHAAARADRRGAPASRRCRPQRPADRELPDAATRLRIVDWEYAGMGDPRFDLANFASHHELDADGERGAPRRLLRREPTPERLAAVRLLRLLAAFWEGMWGVLQASVSELDFDFAAYAAEHLAQARRRRRLRRRTWSSRVPVDRSLPDRARCVIIGGGVGGTSIAYHLARARLERRAARSTAPT